MKSGKVVGVALGPGDPELITLKALKTLQAVDVVFYPSTVNGQGKKSSMSYSVLQHLEIDHSKLIAVEVSMSYNRSTATRTYQQLAADCIEQCRQGKNVAVVSEGDISFYSTFAYLLDDFREAAIEYEMIPGIPAFILGGSLGKFPICTQTDKVLVVPEVADEATLKGFVENNETVVLMKVSKIKEWIVSFLDQANTTFFYGEYMGTDREFITTNLDDLSDRRIPYFSIIVIRNKK